MQLMVLLCILSAPDAVFLSHDVILDCTNPDSGYIETTIERIVPLTARGVERYGTLTVSHRSTWETVTVRHAQVAHWRPGRGEDPAEVTTGPHSSLLPGDHLESSLRITEVRYPGIEIGDTLFLSVTRNISRLPMGDYYSYTFIPAGRDSVNSASLTVEWPSERSMLISGDMGPGETLYEIGGVRTVRWLSGAEGGRQILPFSRGLFKSAPSATIASHSPEEVSAGLWRTLDLQCVTGPDSLADRLLLETGGDPSGMSAWISREIEYVSGNWGLDPGYSPRLPEETVSELSGVCRDRAVLLVWLLRSVGIEAALVLTSSSGDLADLVGSRSFDHMLVAYTSPQGRTAFLDPTLATSSEGFSYALRGAAYLPLTEEGSVIMRFPSNPGGEDSMEISAVLTADSGSENLHGEVNVTFSGSADELFRSMLLGVAEDTRSQLLRTLLGASDGEFSVLGDLSDPSAPLEVAGQGTWRALSGGEGALVLPGLETFDLVANRASAYLMPPVILEPLVETPYRSSLRLEVAGLPVHPGSIPAPLNAGSFSSAMHMEGDVLVLEEEFSLLPIMPSAEELRDMRLAMLARLSSSPRMVLR